MPASWLLPASKGKHHSPRPPFPAHNPTNAATLWSIMPTTIHSLIHPAFMHTHSLVSIHRYPPDFLCQLLPASLPDSIHWLLKANDQQLMPTGFHQVHRLTSISFKPYPCVVWMLWFHDGWNSDHKCALSWLQKLQYLAGDPICWNKWNLCPNRLCLCRLVVAFNGTRLWKGLEEVSKSEIVHIV